jgi:hypothetical protein
VIYYKCVIYCCLLAVRKKKCLHRRGAPKSLWACQEGGGGNPVKKFKGRIQVRRVRGICGVYKKGGMSWY